MQENSNLSYKKFLESIDYDSKEIEKYFENILESLKKEASLITDKRDSKIENLYIQFEEDIKRNDDIKKELIDSYIKSFEDINERYISNLSKINNSFLYEKNQLLDKIEEEKNIIKTINHNILIEYFEKKRPYQDKIDEVSKKLDSEYIQSTNLIFETKNLLTYNNEYYLNAESHINLLDKQIRFLLEFKDYNNSLYKHEIDETESLINKIQIYIDYVNEISQEIASFESDDNVFEPLSSSYNLILSNIEELLSSLDKDIYVFKIDVKEKLDSLKKDLDSINKYYDSLILDAKKEKEKKIINKRRNVLINHITTKLERLSLDSSMEVELLSNTKADINKFRDNLLSLSSSIKDYYNSVYVSNDTLIINTLNIIKEILNDQLESVHIFIENTKDSKEIINYFKNRYNKIDIDNKLKSIQIYKEGIERLLSKSKELDTLAFELVSNQEILKMKLLDLKKEYLTIDDQTKIKEIEYDMIIDELERDKIPRLTINNSKEEILLLEKDLSIDEKILKNEYDNELHLLEVKKEIDLLRCDYIAAYSRLENMSKIIEVKNEYDIESADIKNQIELEKSIQVILLDAIEKQLKYNSMIEKYEKDIENLDQETNQKTRYLNNVLEIEIKTFENKKKKLENISKDLEYLSYPDIKSKKIKTAEKIKNIKKELKEKINKIKEDNEYNINASIELMEKLNKLYDSSSSSFKSLFNKLFENDPTLNLNTSTLKEILNHKIIVLFESINNTLKEYKLKNLEVDYNLNHYQRQISSILNDISKASKEELKSLKKELGKEIDLMLESIKSLSFKEINKIDVLSDLDIEKEIKTLEKKSNENIAKLVIDNTIDMEVDFLAIDDIKKAREKVNKSFEKEISDFKKSYLQTKDSIKEEYNEKLNNLNLLKDFAIKNSKDLDRDMNISINSMIDKVSSSKDDKVQSLTSQNTINQERIDEKILSLSNEIQEKNNMFEKMKIESNNEVETFKENIKEIAKSNFQESLNKKKENEDLLNRESLGYIENRDSYFRRLNANALEFKESFRAREDALIETHSISKADKEIEYAKLYKEVRDDLKESIENIKEPIHSFSAEIEELSDEMNKKVLELTNLFNNSSKDLYTKFMKNIDKDNSK